MRGMINAWGWMIGLLCLSASLQAAEGDHHTFRYQNDYGSSKTFSTMVFSPDSSQLAVSVDHKVDFIDTRLGRITGQQKIAPFSMQYSRDGNRIYMISTGESLLLDTLTGAKIPVERKDTPGFLGLSLEHQNGKLIITKITSGGPVAADPVIGVGDELLEIAEGQTDKFNKVAGRKVEDALRYLKGPADTYVQIKILPKGKFNEKDAQVRVLRRQAADIVGNTYHFKPPTASQVSENLAWCVSGGRHELRSAATGLPVARLTGIDVQNVGLYAISPDGTKFAIVAKCKEDSSRNAVEVFDMATSDRIAYMLVPHRAYYALDFAHDNKQILVATGGTVEIADLEQERFTRRLSLGWVAPQRKEEDESDFSDSAGAVMGAAADNFATGDFDSEQSPRGLAEKIAVSSKNIVATIDRYQQVKLWDLAGGNLLKELPENPRTEKVRSIRSSNDPQICFSPNGQWLAYFVSGILHVVDVSDVEPLPSEPMPLTQVAESPKPEAKMEEPAPISLKIEVGARVEVRSRGFWYPAKIVSNKKSDIWHIHYDDSPEDWDEMVTVDRLRAPLAP